MNSLWFWWFVGVHFVYLYHIHFLCSFNFREVHCSVPPLPTRILMWESTQFLLQPKLMKRNFFFFLQCLCHLCQPWVSAVFSSTEELDDVELLKQCFTVGQLAGPTISGTIWEVTQDRTYSPQFGCSCPAINSKIWSCYTSKVKDLGMCPGAVLFSRRDVYWFCAPWSYVSQNRSVQSLHFISDIQLFPFIFFWITDGRQLSLVFILAKHLFPAPFSQLLSLLMWRAS